MKERPEFYELMIYRKKTLFGDRYTIYQLADEKEILISYDFTAQIEQKERNQFFFLGLGFLAFFGFILIRTLIMKIKESKSGN